jgi:transcriptional regulator with XRE-family HTH domain
MSSRQTHRRRVVVDDSALAGRIGGRIRAARHAAGLTQQQLAGTRYTKAYVSALENGIAKPSMAALNYLAERLGLSAGQILSDPSTAWRRLEADLALATGDWLTAADDFEMLAEDATEPGSRAEAFLGLAEARNRQNRPVDAIRPASEAMAIFGKLGRDADRARAAYWLASAHNLQDNPDEARSLLREILDRTRAGLLIEPDFEARVLIALGQIEGFQDRPVAALAFLEEARALVSDLDDRRRGIFLHSLAVGYREAGDHEGAIRVGLQAMALLRSAQSSLEVEHLENQLALAYLAAGNTERASELAGGARAAALSRGDERTAASVTDTQAAIALAQEDAAGALALADAALELAARSGHSKATLDALVTRARALSALGRHEEATESYARAAELAGSAAPPSRRREVLSAWADALATLGRTAEAYAVAREALEAR